LPSIPAGAFDLTTIQNNYGLPANPYFENGTVQRIGSSFVETGTVLDAFYAQSDVSAVPEPSSTMPITVVVWIALRTGRTIVIP